MTTDKYRTKAANASINKNSKEGKQEVVGDPLILWITGLPGNPSQRSVANLLRTYGGEVTAVTIKPRGGMFRGFFATVEMKTHLAALKAIQTLNGRKIKGCDSRLVLRFAEHQLLWQGKSLEDDASMSTSSSSPLATKFELEEELSASASASASTSNGYAAISVPNRRRGVCDEFARHGQCKYEDRCRFSHLDVAANDAAPSARPTNLHIKGLPLWMADALPEEKKEFVLTVFGYQNRTIVSFKILILNNMVPCSIQALVRYATPEEAAAALADLDGYEGGEDDDESFTLVAKYADRQIFVSTPQAAAPLAASTAAATAAAPTASAATTAPATATAAATAQENKKAETVPEKTMPTVEGEVVWPLGTLAMRYATEKLGWQPGQKIRTSSGGTVEVLAIEPTGIRLASDSSVALAEFKSTVGAFVTNEKDGGHFQQMVWSAKIDSAAVPYFKQRLHRIFYGVAAKSVNSWDAVYSCETAPWTGPNTVMLKVTLGGNDTTVLEQLRTMLTQVLRFETQTVDFSTQPEMIVQVRNACLAGAITSARFESQFFVGIQIGFGLITLSGIRDDLQIAVGQLYQILQTTAAANTKKNTTISQSGGGHTSAGHPSTAATAATTSDANWASSSSPLSFFSAAVPI